MQMYAAKGWSPWFSCIASSQYKVSKKTFPPDHEKQQNVRLDPWTQYAHSFCSFCIMETDRIIHKRNTQFHENSTTTQQNRFHRFQQGRMCLLRWYIYITYLRCIRWFHLDGYTYLCYVQETLSTRKCLSSKINIINDIVSRYTKQLTRRGTFNSIGKKINLRSKKRLFPSQPVVHISNPFLHVQQFIMNTRVLLVLWALR